VTGLSADTTLRELNRHAAELVVDRDASIESVTPR
jgi:hypothetical protein